MGSDGGGEWWRVSGEGVVESKGREWWREGKVTWVYHCLCPFMFMGGHHLCSCTFIFICRQLHSFVGGGVCLCAFVFIHRWLCSFLSGRIRS